jgi:hypothetical protein
MNKKKSKLRKGKSKLIHGKMMRCDSTAVPTCGQYGRKGQQLIEF